jgi:excisionase family DNA binding protein
MNDDKLMGVQEIAKKLSVPPSWIYARTRLIGPKQIPHLKLGKYRRFRFRDVIEWLEEKSE